MMRKGSPGYLGSVHHLEEILKRAPKITVSGSGKIIQAKVGKGWFSSLKKWVSKAAKKVGHTIAGVSKSIFKSTKHLVKYLKKHKIASKAARLIAKNLPPQYAKYKGEILKYADEADKAGFGYFSHSKGFKPRKRTAKGGAVLRAAKIDVSKGLALPIKLRPRRPTSVIGLGNKGIIGMI